MIRFACPRCHATLEGPDHKAGLAISCPGCRQAVTVPAPLAGVPLPPARSPPVHRPVAETRPVTCPGCDRRINLPVGELGTMIECSECDTRFVAERDRPRARRNGASAVASASTTVHVHNYQPFNHTIHLVLTLLTCGAWLPVWIILFVLHK